VVVWQGYDQGGSPLGILGQRFDAAGNPVGGAFLVNTDSSQALASVSLDGDGDFVVVWESDGSSEAGLSSIQAQRFDTNGTAIGDAFWVNTVTEGDRQYPAIDVASDGSFVVVWQGYDQGGNPLGIRGQRFAAAGSPVGGEFLFTTDGSQALASVSLDGDGDFVVVWESDGSDTSDFDCMTVRYDVFGTRVWPEPAVSIDNGFQDRAYSLAVGSAGNAYVSGYSFDGTSVWQYNPGERADAIVVGQFDGSLEYDNNHSIFVVGIDKYNSDFPRFAYTTHDAKNIAAAFGRFGYLPRILLNSDATKNRILTHLSEETLAATSDDTFVFYFSGHGVTTVDGQLAIVVLDDNYPSYLSMAELDVVLSRHPGQVYVILDACFNGDGAIPPAPTEQHSNENPLYLLATSPGRTAVESLCLKSGLFTYSLLRYLNSLDSDAIDFVDLFHHTASETTRLARAHHGIDQQPLLLSSPQVRSRQYETRHSTIAKTEADSLVVDSSIGRLVAGVPVSDPRVRLPVQPGG
jgi:hypothetical protein